jgi:hypothetical protein
MRAETIGRRQDGSRIDGVNSGDRIVARATLLAQFETLQSHSRDRRRRAVLAIASCPFCQMVSAHDLPVSDAGVSQGILTQAEYIARRRHRGACARVASDPEDWKNRILEVPLR